MKTLHCRICGETEQNFILREYHILDRSWDLIKCSHCGLVSTDPMPDDYLLDLKYSSAYWAAANDKSMSVMYNLRMRGFAGRLRKMVNSGNKALDVGAGNGSWVKLLKTKNFDAIGIDPFADAASSLVRKCALEKAPFEDESFDLVTFMHVLEHLRDPVRSLMTAGRFLKPKGLLAIEVPNIDSLGFNLFQKKWFPLDDIPSHINHFSRKSLLNAIQKAGNFKIIAESFFSLKDSPSILANTIFPTLCPRMVRQRHAGRHPMYLKAIYLFLQIALLPLTLAASQVGRGEVVRMVFQKI